MRTMHQSVTCPLCHDAAMLTLTELDTPEYGSEGHEITFECPMGHHFDDRTLLRMWAHERVRDRVDSD